MLISTKAALDSRARASPEQTGGSIHDQQAAILPLLPNLHEIVHYQITMDSFTLLGQSWSPHLRLIPTRSVGNERARKHREQ